MMIYSLMVCTFAGGTYKFKNVLGYSLGTMNASPVINLLIVILYRGIAALVQSFQDLSRLPN